MYHPNRKSGSKLACYFFTFFLKSEQLKNEELSKNQFIFFKKLFVQLLQVSKKYLPLQPQSREIAIKN